MTTKHKIHRAKNSFKEKNEYGQGLSKLNIATILIEDAVEMLFNDMNPISVHVVASSAYQIIRDISKIEDSEAYFLITSQIKDEYLSEFWGHINKAWSFCKHADRDSDQKFDGFDESINEFAIFMAIKLLIGLGRPISPPMQAFGAWFACLWANLLIDSETRDFVQKNYDEFNAEQFSRKEILRIGKINLENIETLKV